MASETPYTSEVSAVDASDWHFGFGAVQASTVFDDAAKVEDRFIVDASVTGVVNDAPAQVWTLTGTQHVTLDSLAGAMIGAAGVRMDAKIRLSGLVAHLIRVGFFVDGEDPVASTPKGVFMEKAATSSACYVKGKDDSTSDASGTSIVWIEGRDVDISVSAVFDAVGLLKVTLNFGGQTLQHYFDTLDLAGKVLSFQVGVKNAGATWVGWTFVRAEGQGL